MKSIVIAGNGPSLSQIDYSRLPQDFDVFRCNQFYFEERYFVGKEVKCVLFGSKLFEANYFSLSLSQSKGEYNIEEYYCSDLHSYEKSFLDIQSYCPNVKSVYDDIAQLKEIISYIEFNRHYHQAYCTSGILMLLLAISKGYKEIYLTGIDFYSNGWLSYAFETKNKKNLKKLERGFTLSNSLFTHHPLHPPEIDCHILKKVIELYDVRLFSLNNKSPINQFTQIAPLHNSCFFPQKKEEGYICDIILPTKKGNIKDWFKNKLDIRKNLFYIIMKDVCIFPFSLSFFLLYQIKKFFSYLIRKG